VIVRHSNRFYCHVDKLRASVARRAVCGPARPAAEYSARGRGNAVSLTSILDRGVLEMRVANRHAV